MPRKCRPLLPVYLLVVSCALYGQPAIADQASTTSEFDRDSGIKASATAHGDAAEANSQADKGISQPARERAELIRQLTIPEHSLAPAPTRLTKPTLTSEPLTGRNSNRGPFVDHDDYEKRAVSAVLTKVVSYGVSGHEPVQIILTADYDSRLVPPDNTCAALGKVANTETGDAGAASADTELKMRVRPADIPPLLDAMPDSRYFKRVLILATDNPEDDWVGQTYSGKGFVSTMAMTDGELSLYKTESSDYLRRDVLHEWSHALRYKYWNDDLMKCFNQATNLELVEWNPSLYAKRNEGEQWAVLGERMLGNSGESFLEACENAPLRSTLWMRALQKCLTEVPGSTVCIDHDKYTQRQRYVDEHVLPLALEKLKVMKVTGATEFLRGQAQSILQYLEPENKSPAKRSEWSARLLQWEVRRCQTVHVRAYR